MEIFTSVFLPIIISLVSSGTVGAIVTAIIKRITHENPSNIAMRLLLQDKLTYLCKKAIDDPSGKISYSNWRLISQIYTSYKDLGGNGDMEHLMHQVEMIPVFVDNPNK